MFDVMARDALASDHREEIERALDAMINRLNLPDYQNSWWILMELYDLGYDHGSTMEAEHGDRA